MNQYGAAAETLMRTEQPERYAAIPPGERETFFTALGEQVAEQIQMRTAPQNDPPPDEDYLTGLGRLRTHRVEAEKAVLAEVLAEMLTQP